MYSGSSCFLCSAAVIEALAHLLHVVQQLWLAPLVNRAESMLPMFVASDV